MDHTYGNFCSGLLRLLEKWFSWNVCSSAL